MPVLFNHDSVDPVSMGDGVTRQPLITPERVKSDCILLDRWTIDAGGAASIDVGDRDLVWFQLLEGEASLDGSAGQHELTTSHVVFLHRRCRRPLCAFTRRRPVRPWLRQICAGVPLCGLAHRANARFGT